MLHGTADASGDVVVANCVGQLREDFVQCAEVRCGVPRFVFTDFPLGNPCGRPFDESSQTAIMSTAVALLGSATAPRSTIQTPFIWNESEDWKDNFMRVDDSNREALREAGDARRAAQAEARKRSLESRHSGTRR